MSGAQEVHGVFIFYCKCSTFPSALVLFKVKGFDSAIPINSNMLLGKILHTK